MEQRITRTAMSNGLTVVSEEMDFLRSVSIGIWVRTGSRHEPIGKSGISHFIEHMLFKGTEHRSIQDIAFETDLLGGNLDAFTSYECAGYSTKVLDEQLVRAFDLVADLVSAPLFDPFELSKERHVILEEIKMIEDAPDELATELFLRNFWPDHRLGTPISGTEETIGQLRQEDLLAYWQEVYIPSNLVIIAAGRVRHGDLLELAESQFGQSTGEVGGQVDIRPQSAASIVIHPKDHLEQVHILLGAECPSLRSEDHYPTLILNTILGGGVSSRLFLKIREEYGLAYAIDSSPMLFTDAGIFTIHAATSPEKVQRVLDLTVSELQRMKTDPIPRDEFNRAQQLVKTSLLLSLDSCSARMSNLARHEIFYGEQFTADQMVGKIEAVTIDDVQRVARDVFQTESLGMVVVGNVDSLRLDRSQLVC